MTDLTNYITAARWEDILTVWYVLIDDAYHLLTQVEGPLRQRGPTPSFSDSEVITVSLLIDTFFHGHEDLGLAFVRQYHTNLFPHLLEPGQFNVRRRALGTVIDKLRRLLTQHWRLIPASDRYRLMDSAPVPVCTYRRATANQTVSGPEYFSVMTSKGGKLCGLRLYLTTSCEQVVEDWYLAPAAPRDGKVMRELLEDAHDLTIFADNAFHDPEEQAFLEKTRRIKIYATPRKDAKTPWPAAFRALATRLRRRVETALSVLTTVFNVEQPHARSLDGIFGRIATRLLAYNLSFVVGPLLARLAP